MGSIILLIKLLHKILSYIFILYQIYYTVQKIIYDFSDKKQQTISSLFFIFFSRSWNPLFLYLPIGYAIHQSQ